MIPVLDGSGTPGKSVLEGAELQAAFTDLKTTLDARLATIDTRVDGVEALIGSTNTLLTTQNGYLDTVEALIAATNTALATLNTAVASTAPADVTIGGLDAAGTLALFTAMRDSLVASYNLNTAGYSLTGGTYASPTSITLAAGASSSPVTVAAGDFKFFDAFFTGTAPSLKLQRRGPDGTTWIDIITRTATGSGDPVGIPNGAVVRLNNSGANALTAVTAVLG